MRRLRMWSSLNRCQTRSLVCKMLTATQLRGLRPHESLILAVLCDLDWRRINPDCSDDDASLFERFFHTAQLEFV